MNQRLGDQLQGFSPLVTPRTRLGALEDKMSEQQAKYDRIMESMKTVIRERALVSPALPDMPTADPNSLLQAAIIALSAQAMGARNAGQAFGRYVNNTQDLQSRQYAQGVQRAQEDARLKAAGLGAQYDALGLDARQVSGDMTNIAKAIDSETERLSKQETQDALNYRAELSSQTKKEVKAMDIEYQQWAKENPAKAFELGKQLEYLVSQGYITQEQAAEAAKAEISKQIGLNQKTAAETTLLGEKAATEKQTRQAKIDEIKSRTKLNGARASHLWKAADLLDEEADIKYINAAASWYRATGAGDLTDEEFNGMDSYIKRLTDEKADSKKYLDGLRKQNKDGSMSALIAAEEKRYKELNDGLYSAEQERKRVLATQKGAPPLDPSKLPGFPPGLKNPGKGAPPKGKIGK